MTKLKYTCEVIKIILLASLSVMFDCMLAALGIIIVGAASIFILPVASVLGTIAAVKEKIKEIQ